MIGNREFTKPLRKREYEELAAYISCRWEYEKIVDRFYSTQRTVKLFVGLTPSLFLLIAVMIEQDILPTFIVLSTLLALYYWKVGQYSFGRAYRIYARAMYLYKSAANARLYARKVREFEEKARQLYSRSGEAPEPKNRNGN